MYMVQIESKTAPNISQPCTSYAAAHNENEKSKTRKPIDGMLRNNIRKQEWYRTSTYTETADNML